MTFLDSSAIIDYLGGVEDVIDYLDGREPFFTSTLCVYEVIDGKLGSGATDVRDVRGDFGGVQALDLTEGIALEAARLQDQTMSDGVRLSTPDALIAATARSTGDELVVSDGDFQTDVLESSLTVTNLRK
ncbi:PIN domain-containing protein [Haloplanus rubicundus]|uniref:Type II toxin-antitoxin system VapC family toxin n=1 Tax=Haloplanus rubicundus TaxID=1547898 RepID=A0A345EFV4_9EURY|nr:PIN domain-containing protein [Haloplanus rubicundus]AXG11076.1 type II toxin-antitoxin system VapC family toxin [Haloplanus rubicundus]